MIPTTGALVPFLVGTLCACVDTSAIVVSESRDASALPDANFVAQCRACLMDDGAPCRTQWDSCVGVPKCADFIECAFELGCVSSPALEDRITCSQPCITQFAITSTDPALAPVIVLNTCSLNACREACVLE